MITHCEDLIATPINLGSHELVSINQLVDYIEDIAGVKLQRHYQLDAPKGRRSTTATTPIKSVLGWEPNTPLRHAPDMRGSSSTTRARQASRSSASTS